MKFKNVKKKLKSFNYQRAAYVLGSFLMAWALYGYFSAPPNDMVNSSVAITNMAQNSGGTGVVLESGETSSTVLTNSHVCGLVQNGGLVSGRAGTYMVSGYKRSQNFDLCLITVDGNLRVQTKVASLAPTPYYEKASVSGHPSLYPNIVTYGHFSGRQAITVIIGHRDCTAEDLTDPRKVFACILLGGLPIAKTYDSVLVSATIMPGSSGSGVYNERNELAGLVFAGQGALGYGWIVPYESVRNFLDQEQFEIRNFTKPSNQVDAVDSDGEKKSVDDTVFTNKLREACDGPSKKNIKDICEAAGLDVTWTK